MSIAALVLITLCSRFSSVFGVMGGQNTTIEDYPFVVSIRSEGELIGTGTLISSLHILTAASVVLGTSVTDLTVLAGSTYRSNKENTGSSLLIRRMIVHPNYEDQLTNNIALLELCWPVEYSDFISPAHLTNMTVKPSKAVTLVSWGFSNYTLDVENPSLAHDRLQKVRLILMDDLKCSESYAETDENLNICAYFPGYDKGGCFFDNGGPLVFEDSVVGLRIFGSLKCNMEKMPDVYTRLDVFYDWLDHETNGFD